MSGHQATIARQHLPPWVPSHAASLRRYFTGPAPRGDADDLVEEVYLRTQALRPAGPIRDMERYLFTVARHVLVDRMRTLAAVAIAERMAISRDTAKERLHRAASRVRAEHNGNSTFTLAKSSRIHPPCRNLGASL